MVLLVILALVCLLAGAAIGATATMLVLMRRQESARDEPSGGDARSGFRI